MDCVQAVGTLTGLILGLAAGWISVTLYLHLRGE